MSGRGQRGNAGGRGGFRKFANTKSSGTSSNQKTGMKPETKKTLQDYSYHLGSAKQSSDFESTTEYMINHMKSTFEYGQDIALTLQELELLDTDQWRPTLTTSNHSDPATKALMDQQLMMQFQEDYKEYKHRCVIYTQNLHKAHGLIWERCAKGMKNKLEARTDFPGEVSEQPIALLKAIKEHALNY